LEGGEANKRGHTGKYSQALKANCNM